MGEVLLDISYILTLFKQIKECESPTITTNSPIFLDTCCCWSFQIQEFSWEASKKVVTGCQMLKSLPQTADLFIRYCSNWIYQIVYPKKCNYTKHSCTFAMEDGSRAVRPII